MPAPPAKTPRAGSSRWRETLTSASAPHGDIRTVYNAVAHAFARLSTPTSLRQEGAGCWFMSCKECHASLFHARRQSSCRRHYNNRTRIMSPADHVACHHQQAVRLTIVATPSCFIETIRLLSSSDEWEHPLVCPRHAMRHSTREIFACHSLSCYAALPYFCRIPPMRRELACFVLGIPCSRMPYAAAMVFACRF